MRIYCPNCQRELTVPDQYAGQMMKCPLCGGNFTAPTLPDASASMQQAPADGTYGLASEPSPPPPPTPEPRPKRAARDSEKEEEKAEPPRPEPTRHAGYQRSWVVWISPTVVPWIAPVAALLVFVLLFFPWASAYVPVVDRVETANAWELSFGNAGSALLIFYVLLFLLTLLVTVVVFALGWKPDLVKRPQVPEEVWKWRSAIVAGLAFLAFIFLAFQVVTGFGGLAESQSVSSYLVRRTFWMWLAVLCHLALIVGALLDFWLTLRGASRPVPRVQVEW